MGLAFTFGQVMLAVFNVLGHAAAIIAAILHNVSTFLGLGNSGRLLLFDETGFGGAGAGFGIGSGVVAIAPAKV